MELFSTWSITIPCEKIKLLCYTCGRLLFFTRSAKGLHKIISEPTIVTLSFSFLTLKTICISPVIIRYSAHFVQHDQHRILKKVLFWSDDVFIAIVYIDSSVTSIIESDLWCMTPRLRYSFHCISGLFVELDYSSRAPYSTTIMLIRRESSATILVLFQVCCHWMFRILWGIKKWASML